MFDDHGYFGRFARKTESFEEQSQSVVDTDAVEIERFHERFQHSRVFATDDVVGDLLLIQARILLQPFDQFFRNERNL